MRLYCDVCQSDTSHVLIRENKNMYQCGECGSVREWKERPYIQVKSIVSKGNRSFPGEAELPFDEPVVAGEELVVQVDGEYILSEVTAIDDLSGRRVKEEMPDRIKTLWVREIENVEVKFSLHEGRITTPLKLVLDGEEVFKVDDTISVKGKRYRILRIKTRDGRLLKYPDQKALAKEIKRVYARYEWKDRKYTT